MSPRVVSAGEWLAARKELRQADHVGPLGHLHSRNTTYAAVSRAPIGKIEPFRRRMGWGFPWYSSQGSDFNYDFHVTNDESVMPIEYNYRTAQELLDMGVPWAARSETVELLHHDKYPEDAR
jgi:predicted dithiol-disulfide oxidoreductase (DUF899 family)